MSNEIAIIGMACRFPGASTVDEYWNNLVEGRETIRFFTHEELLAAGIAPTELSNPNYVTAKGALKDAPLFDAAFFGISPRDAETMDPQHRLFLMCCWEALEHAGYCSEETAGRISIFAGSSGLSLNSYYLRHLKDNQEVDASVGTFQLNLNNGSDFLSTRAAYKFNFTGPSYSIQSGCSTSLVAISEGCQSLLNYQSDMVIAGAAHIDMPLEAGYVYREGMILSPDGHCRAFDESASGTVPGNGVGVVVLKRLEEAVTSEDHIYAVIKGFALNNDGAHKMGYTAPSSEGQAAVIAEALAVAGVDPRSISYVEAHGTGTKQGDPIELQGLIDGFEQTDVPKPYCGIGSVKTNMGHLDAAAGVAGLIKVALSLYHEKLPKTLHFNQINLQINLENTPFYVQTELAPWSYQEGEPRRAGVSSFGIGGTNAHVIVEEAPERRTCASAVEAEKYRVIPLSAKTESALSRQKTQLVTFLKQHPHILIDDVAFTYQVGREVFDCQTFLVARSTQEIIEGALLQVDTESELPKDAEFATQAGKRIPLPTYPFDLRKYWIEPQITPEVVVAQEEHSSVTDTVVSRWKQHLGVFELDLESDFFELGGDSLSANQVMLSLKETLQLDCSPHAIFHYPKLGEFLEHIQSLQKTKSLEYPLSSAQTRLWFLEQYEPGIYHVPVVFRLDGPLNDSALEQSLNTLHMRHAALRTGFKFDDARKPQQFVREHVPFKLVVQDITEAELKTTLNQAAHQLFDLYHDALARFTLYRLGEARHVLWINQHHIITDGWSIRVLLKELSVLYRAHVHQESVTLPPLSYQYKDYCEQATFSEQALTYWLKTLAELPPLDMPTQFDRPPVEQHGGDNVYFDFGATLTQKLQQFSKQQSTTLFTVLLSGLALLLFRYSRQRDFAIGVPVNGRQQANLAGLCGFFVNMLPIRQQFDDIDNFIQLLAYNHSACLKAYEHQEVAFEKILEDLNSARDISRHPLFQVMFIYQHLDDYSALNLSQIEAKLIPNEYCVSQMDLTFHFAETPEGLTGRIEYSTSLFSDSFIRAMAEHLNCLLESVLEAPQQALLMHYWLRPEEQKQLICDWNDAPSTSKHLTTLPALFEAQARQTPHATALVFEDVRWTFAELNEKANQLAHALEPYVSRARQSLIAVCLERSLDMVVGLLGVLKAGAAFVPLDLSQPDARLRTILKEADIDVIVSESSITRHDKTKTIINIDELGDEPIVNPCPQLDEHALAYVLFTSGTTGVPKGVMIRHRNIANLLLDVPGRFGMQYGDEFIAVSPYSFDISILELFAPLLVGATVHVVPFAVTKDPKLLANLVQAHPHAFIQATPSTFQMLVNVLPNKMLPLKILVGGEALTYDLAEKLLNLSQCVWNVYGPTETTIWSTFNRVSHPSEHAIIGRPFQNTSCYVLDEAMNPVPVGVPGELYIGGEGLALGYLNQPDITDKAFISSPFEAGHKLYKTGDTVKWEATGALKYIGRTDNQVKIRGYRIELKEVETALNRVPEITQAVCVARVIQAHTHLVAYYVGDKSAVAIREAMLAQVPEYMVPTYFVCLQALPLTVSGKVNYRALPDPTLHEAPSGQINTPENPLERVISDIWCAVLKRQVVDVETSFFVLGGNSLLMTEVHARLTQVHGAIDLVTLFQYPTVRTLAQFLDGCEVKAQMVSLLKPEEEAIAIIGMAGRFPEAADITRFWENLCAGKESIQRFSDEEMQQEGVDPELLQDQSYVNAGGVLADSDCFDADFFNYSAAEARIINPQHRVFLECVWHALENAGYTPKYASKDVGVFAGSSSDAYLYEHLLQDDETVRKFGQFELMIANSKDQLTTRVSHALGLTGPSVNVQTACSTSLVAVHLACQSLLRGESRMAIAGAVSIQARQKTGYLYRAGMTLSPDGHCRAFDKDAAGTVGGNGVGALVLKRLQDAIADGDKIDAVIKATAINNDGSSKVGYTAPSVSKQSEVIAEALSKAHVSAEEIQYVETHGTGTLLGDPIEISALTQAYQRETQKTNFCAIGSVKPNIGHLDVAAGIAGLIKTVLALKHKKIPASLHFKTPNPNIRFSETPFYVNQTTSDWPSSSTKKRAGVSSFGIGGTNAHVILEEAPILTEGAVRRSALPSYPFERTSHFVYAKKQQICPTPQPETQSLRGKGTLEILFALWEEVLGVRPEHDTVDFDELGGHSMLAVQLIARIQQVFEIQLPVSWVLSHSTIQAQAADLKLKKQHYDPIIQFTPAHHGIPLVFVHPGHAGAEVYAELAQLLAPEYALYAVESYNLHHTEAPLKTIEALAAHYVQEIKKLLPSGPYYLGGWSFGGTIAYEMARQLEAAGEEVSDVWLLDSVVFDEEALADESALNALFYPLEHSPSFNQLPKPYQEKLSVVYALELAMLKAYRAKADLSAEVRLFNASEGMSSDNLSPLLKRLKHKNNWPADKLRFSEIQMASNHYGIMTQPFISKLAQHMKQSASIQEAVI